MFRIIFLFSIFVAFVSSHTYLDSIWLNGVNLASGDCVRPHPPTFKENPISVVSSPDMTCGFLPYADQPANRRCSVAAGSAMSLQWWHTQPGDDVIATTHKGPCMIYLAKSDTGAGNVWFKIYESGLDVPNQVWCVDTLILNRGRLDFTLPADIQPGDYLLRGEIIALHNAGTLDGSQPYVHCVELTITGGGSAVPTGLVAFPGDYLDTDPGLYPVSLYNGPVESYIIPGPPVYESNPSNTNPVPGTNPPPSPTATGSSSYTPPSSGSTPATTVSTCGGVSVTKTQRIVQEPLGHNLFDLSVHSTSSIAPGGLTVTIVASSGAAIQSWWNLQPGGAANTYTFTEAINAGTPYTGAGFVAQGSDASADGVVQIVCASSGSSYSVQSTSGSASYPSSSTTTTGSSSTPPPPSYPTVPTVSSSATCSAITLSTALRQGASWGNPPHNIYDITAVNHGSSDVTDLVVSISITGSATGIDQVWNMAHLPNTNNYWFTEKVKAGATYTSAGYIIAGGAANIAIVCPSSGSTSTTGSVAPPASTTSTTTTGSVAPPSTTTTTTGSSSTSCRAGISFSISQSWNGGGMMAVVITNAGSKPITGIQVQVFTTPATSWNLQSTSTANVFTLPSWGLPIAVGAKFDSAGFTFTGSPPAAGSVLSVVC